MTEGSGNYVIICPKGINADLNANVNDGDEKLCELRHPRTDKAATFIWYDAASNGFIGGFLDTQISHSFFHFISRLVIYRIST